MLDCGKQTHHKHFVYLIYRANADVIAPLIVLHNSRHEQLFVALLAVRIVISVKPENVFQDFYFISLAGTLRLVPRFEW